MKFASIILIAVIALILMAGAGSAAKDDNTGDINDETVNIKPNNEEKLIFVSQPTDTVLGEIISPPVKVEIRDHKNNLMKGSNSWVTVAIGSNPGMGTLEGAKKKKTINGVATFDDLSINKVGKGYTLKASSDRLTEATSKKFDIKAINSPTYTHTITPSPMVDVRVKDTVTSTSTSGNKMEFNWIRPDGHSASRDSVPRLNQIYVDSHKPNVAGLWTINVIEFKTDKKKSDDDKKESNDDKKESKRHDVEIGKSSTTFTVTENPEFGKLGAMIPLFAVGFIYMNYRKKLNK